ncbi:MAG: aldolase/citrate lyase family protein [Acidobacteriota bacterium]
MPALKINQAKKKLKEGKAVVGTMVSMIRSPQVVSLLSAVGWDFFILDTEHSQFGWETMTDFMTVARHEEIVPLVRVADPVYHLLARTLDLGALGLICPRVETREAVESIVRHTKYLPLGERGAAVSIVHSAFRDVSPAEYLEWANQETLVVIQPESKKAIDDIDSLVSVPGLDAVFIGPYDLSKSLGVPGQTKHPLMVEAFERVIAACNRHGVAPGVHLQDVNSAREWIGRGMRFVGVKNDFRFLSEAMVAATQELKAGL